MKAHEFVHEMTNTSSIFGRKNVSVIFEGKDAKTDGENIFLPELPSDADLTREQIQMMRGYVDHEAGHIRHSDMPFIMEEYQKWGKNGHEGLITLDNYAEDMWIEPRVIQDYPGAEKNLRTLNDVVGRGEVEWAEKNKKLLKEFNIDSACFALSVAGREHLSYDSLKEMRTYVSDDLYAHAVNWNKHIQACTNSREVAEVAKSIYELIKQDPDLKSKPEDFDPKSGEGAGEGKGDATEKQKQAGQGDGKGKGKDKGMGEGRPSAQQSLEKGMPGGIGKPEGDYKGSYRILTTRYDDVFSVKNPGKHSAFKTSDVTSYQKDRASVQSHVAVMKSKLRRSLLSKQRRDWDFGREVGRLDSKRLVAAYSGTSSVFKGRIDRDEENTAIQILVDLSGSMYGEKLAIAQKCAIALAECFEGTSLNYQITGFEASWPEDSTDIHNMYRDASKNNTPYHRCDVNYMYNFKPFEMPLRSARPALGSIKDSCGGSNADRDAIIWCLNTLKQRNERRKILLVLSDGNPANTTVNVGYPELTRHAKEAVHWGTTQGIECVGIGICDNTVEKIYPDAVVVHSVADLAESAFRKFTNLLLKGKK